MKLRSFGPCDPLHVDRLEAELRIELPKQYRQWLLETNGGIVEEQPYFPMRDNPHSDAETLRAFYGMVPSHPEYDICATIHDHLWILRQDHIPIGFSGSSGILSVELTSWSDKIYFFDICDEGEQNGLRTPYFVAESIHDLIASLRTDD